MPSRWACDPWLTIRKFQSTATVYDDEESSLRAITRES